MISNTTDNNGLNKNTSKALVPFIGNVEPSTSATNQGSYTKRVIDADIDDGRNVLRDPRLVEMDKRRAAAEEEKERRAKEHLAWKRSNPMYIDRALEWLSIWVPRAMISAGLFLIAYGAKGMGWTCYAYWVTAQLLFAYLVAAPHHIIEHIGSSILAPSFDYIPYLSEVLPRAPVILGYRGVPENIKFAWQHERALNYAVGFIATMIVVRWLYRTDNMPGGLEYNVERQLEHLLDCFTRVLFRLGQDLLAVGYIVWRVRHGWYSKGMYPPRRRRPLVSSFDYKKEAWGRGLVRAWILSKLTLLRRYWRVFKNDVHLGLIYEKHRAELRRARDEKHKIKNQKSESQKTKKPAEKKEPFVFVWYAVPVCSYESFLSAAAESTNYASQIVEYFLPEAALFATICGLLAFAAFDLGENRAVSKIAAETFAAACAGLFLVGVMYLALLLEPAQVKTLFSGYLFTSRYVVALKFVVLIAGLFVLHTSRSYVTSSHRPLIEFPIMLALALLFMLLLVGANHVMTMFLALAGFSLNMYILILFDAPQHVSREAGVKYYYLSTLSTGFILYGAFLLYMLHGSGRFDVIDFVLRTQALEEGSVLLQFGMLLMFVGFFFKLSSFPGHLWAADVYEGSPAPVTAFFMLPVKAAVLAFVLRFISSALDTVSVYWFPWMLVASVASIVWGCFAALTARSTRRFLAFTSINQMGFILIGVLSHTAWGYRSALIYLLIYILMGFTFMLVFIQGRRADGSPFLYLTDFRELGGDWKKAWATISALFSMAGIPPLAGFFGKYYLLLHALQEGLFGVVAIALAASLVSTYYYLRMIKIMWFEVVVYNLQACRLSGAQLAIMLASQTLLWGYSFFDQIVLNAMSKVALSLVWNGGM